MAGVLLDTHALYWMVSGEDVLTDAALAFIGRSQEAGTLYVSAISAWELAVASQKSRVSARPRLGERSPSRWFREALAVTGARLVHIGQRIALEAAQVVTDTGHRDPGDCFLIATARRRKVPLVTRDAIIRGMAANNPTYLDVVVC